MTCPRFAVLCVLLLAGSAGLQCAAWQTVHGDPELEEYAAYAAVISQLYVGPETQIIVISPLTMANDQLFRFVFEQSSSLSPTTSRDFDAKNHAPHALKPLFQPTVPAVLLSEDARRDVFQNRAENPAGADEADWQRFYERYPTAPGILSFSRVGLNPRRTQALVLVGRHWGGDCGWPHRLCWVSQYVLLTKQQGTWTVAEQKPTPHAY
jgi:hypothetical protein